MCLCPHSTNLFTCFDEVLLFCIGQAIATFNNAVWMDTRVIWNVKKKERKSSLPLRPMVKFGRFQCFIWERSKHCVHMKQKIYYQNRSIMSQMHSFENKSWPLDDLELWPFDLFTHENYASKLVKCFKFLFFFSNKIHINRTTLAFSVDCLDFRW